MPTTTSLTLPARTPLAMHSPSTSKALMLRPTPPPAPATLTLSLDLAGLRALVKEIVAVVLAEQNQTHQALPEGRLAWSELEAARLLGLEPHQLRDERRRGA